MRGEQPKYSTVLAILSATGLGIEDFKSFMHNTFLSLTSGPRWHSHISTGFLC